MNNALFAIPGLMVPAAPNFHSQLTAPEDGSLCICVHCGRSGENVNYAVRIPGTRGGVIKDPSYNYGPMSLVKESYVRERTDKMPQFLTISEILPPDALVPRCVVNGCPIRITERPGLCNPLYWILRLPVGTLPPGDTTVEVVVNGRHHAYVVQRPAFGIHSRCDVTPRLQEAQHQHGEKFDVAIQELTPRDIVLRLANLCEDPVVLQDAAYRANLIFNGVSMELALSVQGDAVHIHIPALPAGKGIWKCEYRIFDDWLQLSSGDLVVIPVTPCERQIVEVPSSGGEFTVKLSPCDLSIYEGAEFDATILVNGTQSPCTSVLSPEGTLTLSVPATTSGTGLWSVRYKLFDEWLDLSAGTIRIV